jgi:SAM-dependent methyltransferase
MSNGKDQDRTRVTASTGDIASTAPIDVEVLREEIQKTYTDVSGRPEQNFVFPTGRGWADELGYPKDFLDRVPEATVESFAGVGNHFKLGSLDRGETVLDLGCGAGTDLLVSAQMVGPEGKAIGIDMTKAMVTRARQSASDMGLTNVTVYEGLIEKVPLDDESVDVVISNGVIDLVPDKDAVFSEIWRVLRSGGRLQVADITIKKPVSEEGKRDIDLWTG